MKPLAILKLGATFPEIAARLGDFDDWIRAVMVNLEVELTTVQVHEGEPLPNPDSILGAIVTGSHAMVTDRPPWSVPLAEWLRAAVPAGLPVLGICYGHQLLADAFGGRVDNRPGGPEIGTVEVTVLPAAASDPLFSGLPPRFFAHASHWQSALILPEGATALAATALDRHTAFALAPRAWGVQFHPEFTAAVLAGYIQQRYEQLLETGRDPDRLLASIKPAPVAAGVLTRFATLAMQ